MKSWLFKCRALVSRHSSWTRFLGIFTCATSCFNVFINDSCSYFYSTRHNFIRLLRATEDGLAITESDKSTMKLVRQNERFYGSVTPTAALVAPRSYPV